MNRVSRVRALAFADGPVPEPIRDREIPAAYAEDASGRPPGAPAGLLRPAGEAEIAAFLRATAGRGVRVLPQAARSSLTGGAIPQGEVVISVERLTEGLAIGGGRARVAAGVRLRDLQAALAERGAYFPPVPTYQEAMIGGAASTFIDVFTRTRGRGTPMTPSSSSNNGVSGKPGAVHLPDWYVPHNVRIALDCGCTSVDGGVSDDADRETEQVILSNRVLFSF